MRLQSLRYGYAWFGTSGVSDEDNSAHFIFDLVIVYGIRYLIKNKSKLFCETCSSIAKYGNIKLLKWAHDNGYVWDEESCNLAAINGHLDILKYLHEKGCQWT